ncbi:MAG: 30S ribosomal protein S27ae [Candidatus Kariarchaeaceae archaeon]|jgi:small subunit ribosomal protein S27Ae
MSRYFEVQGESLERKFVACSKCGPGYFMGVHSNRTVCGSCGYTEFKGQKKGRKRRK